VGILLEEEDVIPRDDDELADVRNAGLITEPRAAAPVMLETGLEATASFVK
jgi:hypothetical protein